MQNMKRHFSFLLVLGFIISAPAHAESSMFDSINQKLKKISKEIAKEVKEKIDIYYGNTPGPEKKPEEPPKKAETQPPVVTPDPFASCKKFLGYMYDTNYVKDTKKVATIYLNAAVDVTNLSYDTKPSKAEMDERNKCVKLALETGADPDSSGRDESTYSFKSPLPLVRAVRNNNKEAVKILLEYKANPNVEDTSLGNAVPLMNTAIYTNQEIAVDLINAGIDLTTPHLLWIAAGNAADEVVDLIIQSKQIPVNQLNKFTDFSDEEGETALDSSESRLFSLLKYKKKIAANPKMSVQDKIIEANGVLYYNYPLIPQLKMSSGDPDAFMNDLQKRQERVSELLKAAGGVCQEDNCGILDFEMDR
nr:ankyrin repeat domain-containing protein [Bacteriovorax sp. HI3]